MSLDRKTPELKPCPFCEAVPQIYMTMEACEHDHYEDDKIVCAREYMPLVICDTADCPASHGDRSFHSNFDLLMAEPKWKDACVKAVTLWNRRALPVESNAGETLDPRGLEPEFSKWMLKLTADGLYSKADIAAALADLERQRNAAMKKGST